MNGDLTLDDLMTTVAHLDSTMEVQRQEISDLREELHAQRQRNDKLEHHVGYLMAYHVLLSGLLPERMAHVSRLAIQIFHKPMLTTKERQRRHTHWSLKIEVSIHGRRVGKGIDVSLYPGRVLDAQVMDAADVPPIIKAFAENMRDVEPSDALFGMLTRKSEGEGTPREHTQFCVLSGHETGTPRVQMMVDDVMAACDTWAPGKGRKEGKALLYGTTKPNLS
jgi:hypothetical protein